MLVSRAQGFHSTPGWDPVQEPSVRKEPSLAAEAAPAVTDLEKPQKKVPRDERRAEDSPGANKREDQHKDESAGRKKQESAGRRASHTKARPVWVRDGRAES